MRSADYWARRAEESEAIANRKSASTIREITEAYEKAMEDTRQDMLRILGKTAKDGKITRGEARALLNRVESRKILEELRQRISLIKDPDLKQELLLRINAPAYRARLTRLQALQDNIEVTFSRLAETQLQTMHTRLIDTMSESYMRTIYNLQTGIGLGFSFSAIPSRAIQAALEHKWEGKNYSERVWHNTDYVAKQAKKIIPSGLATGKTVRRMAAELAEEVESCSYAAERLIRTEVNYFYNRGAKAGYQEAKIGKYRYLATLDKDTCKVCGALDRKVFLLSEAVTGKNYPPIHYNDRCTVCPEIDGKDYSALKRRARDPVTGKNYLVPAETTWEEWTESIAPRLAKPADGGTMADVNLTPIKITDEAIDNVPLVKSPSLTEDQNALLRQENQELLRYMRDDPPGREGIAYYSSDMSRRLYRAKGQQGQVTAKPGISEHTICIHNHPTGNTFTHTDVLLMLRDPSLKTLIAAGNNGKVFLLEKGTEFDRLKALESLNTIKPALDPQTVTPESYLQTMQKFLSGTDQYGLIYREG